METYVGIDQDTNGGMTHLGRIVMDGWVFGCIPENETCARYSPDMSSIVLLKNSDYSDDVFLMNTSTLELTNLSQTPLIRDGWPMFAPDGKHVYYSSMESGIYNIYKIKPDGSNKIILTCAKQGEEDARVYASRDGKSIIYNKRYGKTIEIRKLSLS